MPTPLKHVHVFHFHIIFSANQFDELNNFVTKVGWSLIFDLNSLLREGGQWLPDNAKLLMDYTSQKGYKITGWELGNGENFLN